MLRKEPFTDGTTGRISLAFLQIVCFFRGYFRGLSIHLSRLGVHTNLNSLRKGEFGGVPLGCELKEMFEEDLIMSFRNCVFLDFLFCFYEHFDTWFLWGS